MEPQQSEIELFSESHNYDFLLVVCSNQSDPKLACDSANVGGLVPSLPVKELLRSNVVNI